MEALAWLVKHEIQIGTSAILLREVIGNIFGLASAVGGMRRKVWAWPIGIIGNVVLFTCFLGGVFDNPQNKDMVGQAGRQVFFLMVSAYGWYRWYSARHSTGDGVAVRPRWARAEERLAMLGGGAVIYVAAFYTLKALDSWGPTADAWILTGSILATYGMARGYVEFWLIWIAVDVVGVPLLFKGGFYPSAVLYIVYGAFCVWGLITWYRIQQREGTAGATTETSEAAGQSVPVDA